jgi:hypothetical protein
MGVLPIQPFMKCFMMAACVTGPNTHGRIPLFVPAEPASIILLSLPPSLLYLRAPYMTLLTASTVPSVSCAMTSMAVRTVRERVRARARTGACTLPPPARHSHLYSNHNHTPRGVGMRKRKRKRKPASSHRFAHAALV